MQYMVVVIDGPDVYCVGPFESENDAKDFAVHVNEYFDAEAGASVAPVTPVPDKWKRTHE